ncbi:hypothetical protein CC78DRAFT_618524 [Lojkania enalia]|uniref:Uncharacterized protein n=1 Tax=Lojkania enalia TaxID=147567 RepID=A0A9P4N1L2_9PLEO|nr:hypothetical protein CC78DRAFT_618524 [Didymosphaeria enalia]
MQQNQLQTRQQIQQPRTDITTGHQVVEYNSIVRLQNSGIGRSDAPLTILRELATSADV